MKYRLFLLCFVLMAAVKSWGAITGFPTVCEGATTTLDCASPSGGTWSSSAPAIAAVGLTNGVVTGISAGTATIYYTMLPTVYSIIITVNASPAPISASDFHMCVGEVETFHDATVGGTWLSSTGGVADVGLTSGYVTAYTAGTATIQYVLTSTGCAASAVVTVNPLPTPVTGASSVCTGNTAVLGDATPGGTWVSGNPSVAVVSSSGSVTGIAAGVANISYQLVTGCSAVRTMSVNVVPSYVSGSTNICAGTAVSLSCTPSGGTWSSGTATLAVDAVTGMVTGVAAGAGMVTYSLSSGCYRTYNMTVNPVPGTISGPDSVCQGASTSLSNSVSGGSWTSSNVAVATVSGAVSPITVVSGVSAGTTVISYITGSSSCAATRVFTVVAPAVAGTLSGSTLICSGTTTTISPSVSGGTWTSSLPSIASVSGGIVTGHAAGTAGITYTRSGSCGPAHTAIVVTVSATPGPVLGPDTLCTGVPATLTNSVSGGVWTSSNPSVASVGIASGTTTGLAAGVAAITYAVGACQVSHTVNVFVAPGPVSGSDVLCVGDLAPMTDTVYGGTWSSSSPTIADIGVVGGTPGVAVAFAPGTATISYSLGVCAATLTVTVNPLPAPAAAIVRDGCGGGYTMSVAGGYNYSWSPASGLSCSSCAAVHLNPSVTNVYTVTVTDAVTGCAADTALSVSGNRILGHISFNGPAPAFTDVKVWLVQYSPADSSIIAMDSTTTCMDGAQPFYMFDGIPAGNYMVHAGLISAVPGTSDYAPTYAGATAHWVNASSAVHTAATDTLNVNMQFGLYATGAGFISGNVYASTDGTPHPGTMVFLKDAVTGKVATWTYTDASGAYNFAGLGLGTFIVYPEEFDYYTTPSAVVTLEPGVFSASDVSFARLSDSHTIVPFSLSAVDPGPGIAGSIAVYPNPARDYLHIDLPVSGHYALSVRDLTGREVIAPIAVSGQAVVNISTLAPAIYLAHIAGEEGAVTTLRFVVSR